VAGWNGHDTAGWLSLADGVDAIVNLAGENIGSGRWTRARKQAILESRRNAGKAVIRAVEDARGKPRVVVQASGIGYYGPHGDENVTEETSAGRDFLAQIAVEWERSTAPVESLGVRRAVIRTGVVLSAEGGALPRMLLPFPVLAIGPLGSGRQALPWIHIDDEVAAIRFLMTNDSAGGAFNLTSPSPVTNAEFTRAFARQLGREVRMPLPAFIIRTLFGEMAGILLDGQRAMPERLLAAGFRFRFPEIEEALRDLLGRHG
jgi:uncharacterized protein (TIGR01777 family)